MLVTIDTLRWDYVSADCPPGRGPAVPRTPALDGLAAHALRFTNARSPVPLTLPSHVCMLSGLPPAATGVRVNDYGRLPPAEERGFALLPERLRAAGWTAGAFVSAAVLGHRYGLDQAFDAYDDGGLVDHGGATVAQRPGPDTVAAALAWLGAQPRSTRVFLWLHLFEPHAPYVETGTYAGGVVAADRAAGTFLAGLERLRPHAAVLLTADHGEALGALHERTHGLLLSDAVLRVPFLLRVPGHAPGVREDPVELTDVAPTLARVAGVSWPAAHGPGCGRDVLAGPVPTTRVRVAESLYGQHLHRWAQLRAATGPSGTLVDAGLGRQHWLPPSGWRKVRTSTDLVHDDPETRRLAKVLVEYNHMERPALLKAGQADRSYGGGGPVSPFLPAEVNARLPDPHQEILLHLELDDLKARLLGGGGEDPQTHRLRLDRAVGELRVLVGKRLAGSPEAWFWLGLGCQERAALAARLGEAPGPYLAKAGKAYRESFRLGRKDTTTLVHAFGVDALGHEEQALAHLEAAAAQVESPGCEYWLLRARLLQTLEAKGMRPAGTAARACRKARAACRQARDRAKLEKTCR